MGNRKIRALIAAGFGAGIYLAGSELSRARPVRAGSLFILGSAAFAGLITARNTAQTAETRRRLDALIGGDANGESHIHAQRLHIHGDHHVYGDTYSRKTHTVGQDYTGSGTVLDIHNGDTHHNGHAVRGLDHLYDNGGDFGIYGGNLFMNGHDLWMGGGSSNGADIHLGDGHIRTTSSGSWP